MKNNLQNPNRLLSTFVLVIIIILVIIGGYSIIKNLDKTKSSLTSEKEEIWTTFTAEELGVKISYPESWAHRYTISPFAIDFVILSEEKISYLEPVSGQTLTDNLIEILIYKYDNFNKLTLND